MKTSSIVFSNDEYLNNQVNRLEGTNYEIDQYPMYDYNQIIGNESKFDETTDEIEVEAIDDTEQKIVYWTNAWNPRESFEKMYLYGEFHNVVIEGTFVEQNKDTAFKIFGKYGAEAVGLPSGSTYKDFKKLVKQVIKDWNPKKVLGYVVIDNLGLVRNSYQLDYLASKREQRIGYFVS